MTEKVSWNEDVPEGTDYKQTQWVKDRDYNLSMHLHPQGESIEYLRLSY